MDTQNAGEYSPNDANLKENKSSEDNGSIPSPNRDEEEIAKTEKAFKDDIDKIYALLEETGNMIKAVLKAVGENADKGSVADIESGVEKDTYAPEYEYGDKLKRAYAFYSEFDKSVASDMVDNNKYVKKYLGAEDYKKLKEALRAK
jgi:hypothetical protein